MSLSVSWHQEAQKSYYESRLHGNARSSDKVMSVFKTGIKLKHDTEDLRTPMTGLNRVALGEREGGRKR